MFRVFYLHFNPRQLPAQTASVIDCLAGEINTVPWERGERGPGCLCVNVSVMLLFPVGHWSEGPPAQPGATLQRLAAAR